jgi:hypothetical protein
MLQQPSATLRQPSTNLGLIEVLTSTMSANYLAQRLLEHFGKKGTFFITEVHSDRQGWALKQLWHMLKNPEDPRLKT